MEYPKVLSLNPQELIDWCNMRRKEMGLSKAKLAEKTGVPESTLDRIFSGKNPEFRYSTIQPIMAVLVQFNEELPQPDKSDDTQNEYYYNTIEGYKLIVENKNHIIETLKKEYSDLEKLTEYLKEQNDKKDDIIQALIKKG